VNHKREDSGMTPRLVGKGGKGCMKKKRTETKRIQVGEGEITRHTEGPPQIITVKGKV